MSIVLGLISVWMGGHGSPVILSPEVTNTCSALVDGGMHALFSDLWGKVIRWLLTIDAEARPTAGELLSSALLPPKLEVEAAFLR